MAKSLQKPANRLCELALPHPGILDQQRFNQHFELHCYEPPLDLKPFVVHVWTQRRKSTSEPAYRPIEILSGPNVYLFFTPDASFIHTITPGVFEYNTDLNSTIAGVKFRPGGFYAFWQQSMTTLADKTHPIEEVFPRATSQFTASLLTQSDQHIVTQLVELLRDKQPVGNKNIELIAKVMQALDQEKLYTVEAIAHKVGKSERSLQLLFHDYVGVGLKWVIIRKRLLQTVQHIHESKGTTLATAAAQLGYSSQSHFTNEFRRIIGLPPSEYIKLTKS